MPPMRSGRRFIFIFLAIFASFGLLPCNDAREAQSLREAQSYPTANTHTLTFMGTNEGFGSQLRSFNLLLDLTLKGSFGQRRDITLVPRSSSHWRRQRWYFDDFVGECG